MTKAILENTVNSFNQRQYKEAMHYSAEGLSFANGQDEAFWMGLNEVCEAYELLERNQIAKAESKLVASMEKLRNFGFRYQNFEVTVALAGIRRALEEIRAVRGQSRKVFDVSIVPQFRLAAKADD
ncbi:MAG: hypothetical protein KOO60_04665 [Gemmatimonadales bacterium]|nr:hypothetical protein [Gemmatimonadales bacterium]